MLYWAFVFLVTALVAGLLGFGGVASTAAGIAQVLFFIFLIVFVVALVMGLVSRRPLSERRGGARAFGPRRRRPRLRSVGREDAGELAQRLLMTLVRDLREIARE